MTVCRMRCQPLSAENYLTGKKFKNKKVVQDMSYITIKWRIFFVSLRIQRIIFFLFDSDVMILSYK